MKKRTRRSVRTRRIGCLLIIILILIFAALGIHKVWGMAVQTFKQVPAEAEQAKPKIITLGDEINSKNAVLIDLQNGTPICEKASGDRAYPASLTKIMTTILAIEKTPDLQKQILVPANIFKEINSKNASVAGFLPGEKVKAIDLLYGTMLPSGADAAKSLAVSVAGSSEAFVALMNQKAAELGMKNTHFTNEIGLQDPEHYTTAEDMAMLLKYALKNDTFRKIFTSTKYSASPTNKHKGGVTFYSTVFHSMKDPDFTGGAIIGGKTGYTEAAGLCLASLAEKNGHDYILVTAGANGNHETEQFDFDDAFYIYNKYLP
ncbi:MAG: D-alanyl-D-alanine carboxypeptidase [Bacillota bacterium]|nr:D-alanyl-D-alanine carboxypeptidase [Bacillota bacterium]